MDQGHPRSHRITRQSDIDACYRQGRRWNGRTLRIHVRENGLPHARLAISVPGRLCGAVQRNRWKRLIREAFRLNQARIGAGIDVVVVPTRPPAETKRAEVERQLLELVERHRGGGAR